MSEHEPGGGRLRILVILMLIAGLIFGTVIISQHLRNAAAIQDCVASGRTNCAPIRTDRS
jgi:hypothetical protein